jgi:hypothetical protein
LYAARRSRAAYKPHGQADLNMPNAQDKRAHQPSFA